MALAAAVALPAAAQPRWAHQAAGFQSNGQVVVRSLSGGSYSGSQNPTGAVAKVNQSAATQPPTVIIQATGSTYSETYPILVNAASAPACPAGYSSIYVGSGTGPITTPIVNAGGSRFTLGSYYHPSNGWTFNAIFVDGLPLVSNLNNFALNIGTANGYVGGANYPWAARICSK